ncbi:MAG: ammonia-forming cytochrome c nitrite reductase subunit c552 [Anaerolineaceae bacterium]|nr:MAG: ammonia-forming cytochrome c nitrite reductase subunit c552 [Anaerolineaceae bacterium]
MKENVMRHRIPHRPPRTRIHRPRSVQTFILLLGLGLFAFALTALATPAQAAPAYQEDKPSNDFCLACHQQQDIAKTLGNETLPVTINPTQFGRSVHAQENILCVDCHTDISDYPHPTVRENSIRAYSLASADTCKECHEDKYEKIQDSVHQVAFDAGNQGAPICADCHNPHTQPRLIGRESGELTIAARKLVPETCAECHVDIYNNYRESVHGKALTEEGNVDVPTCVDCHGVHDIHDPTTASFHNSTPGLCAKCHENAEIMDKYGISTNVVNTYVADFHGATVKLFEEQYPDQPTNKAVCTDCHGVHDIAKTGNPATGVAMQENLLTKCQRCHPGATANFPAAWMSHYEPSPEHYPIVYYVNLFYKFFIPTVLGGMTFFVLTDIYRRIVNRAKGRKHA